MDWSGLPGLVRDFPAWQVELHELGTAWTAVKRDGTSVHVLAARDLDDLREKIGKAQEMYGKLDTARHGTARQVSARQGTAGESG